MPTRQTDGGQRWRADALLVERGLAPTRAKAQEAIRAGGVTADGAVLSKPGQIVTESVVLLITPPYPWVSRAGVKLAFALDRFALDPSGRWCLDIGASTGGFTDVLLARRAAHVTAVDVGRDQLHPRLRADARVTSLETTDARALTSNSLTAAPSLIVCDVSFIGLAKAIGPALGLAAGDCDLVALIKPQFESGPRPNETLAADEARRIAEQVAASLEGLQGFAVRDLADSPIQGGAGAPEHLLWARRTGQSSA